MTRKQTVAALINEMVVFGETYFGTYEVQGEKLFRLYKEVSKEAAKQYPDKVVIWDSETGIAWMA